MLITTRQDAQRLGIKRFFTGVQCQRGHAAERYTSTGGCVECHAHVYQRELNTPLMNQSFYFMPVRGLGFKQDTTALEAQAAFQYMEEAGWHNAAVDALRANPALMDKYINTLTALQMTKLTGVKFVR